MILEQLGLVARMVVDYWSVWITSGSGHRADKQISSEQCQNIPQLTEDQLWWQFNSLQTQAQQWKPWVVKVAASCYITTKIVARMNKSIRNIHVVIIILGLKYQHTLFIDSKKWTKVPPECRTFSSSQKCCAECDKLTTCITTTIRFCHVSNFSTRPTLIYLSSLQICAL